MSVYQALMLMIKFGILVVHIMNQSE
ncbi:putative holin-like toxin [Tuberibacillus sp. Marseille-P3662]